MVYNRDLKYDAMGGERERDDWVVVSGDGGILLLWLSIFGSLFCCIKGENLELNISPWNSCVLLPISHCFYIYYYVSLLHARTYPYLRGISIALRHFNFTTRALKEQRCTWGDRLPANLTRINDFLRWEGKSQVNYHFIISKRTERWKIRVNFDRGWRWMRTEFL